MNLTQATITAQVRHYDVMARSLFPAYAAMPVPDISFFTKGNVNGRANRIHWHVSFNTTVAEQVPDEFANTVSHEIAHMVDYAIRGFSNHDKTWKAIHYALGGTAKRCSQYKNIIRIAGRVTNSYLYRNEEGKELWVGARHHAALRRGKYSYIHNPKTGVKVYMNHFTGQSRKNN